MSLRKSSRICSRGIKWDKEERVKEMEMSIDIVRGARANECESEG